MWVGEKAIAELLLDLAGALKERYVRTIFMTVME
jgi:hypothetical protein